MKSNSLFSIAALLAVLALPTFLIGQAASRQLSPASVLYTVTDLGTLAGGNFSQPFYITKNGRIAGSSNLTGGASHAVLWHNSQMTDMGTLGGTNSVGFGVNNANQSIGFAESSVSDPNGEDFCGFGTHLICLPFFWENNVMTPLPTLGGNNGSVSMINGSGTSVGWAETAAKDSACPAPQVLQFGPVLWRNGKAIALSTYAGDPEGVAYGVNEVGVAVGATGTCVAFNPASYNSLRAVHAVMWDSTGKVTDLGNLGGTTGAANGNLALDVNIHSEAVGGSDLQGDTAFNAFRWTRSKGMQNLGTLSGDVDSIASSVNDSGVIVGDSFDQNFNSRAFIWQNGKMTDLNTLVVPGSDMSSLSFGCSINNRGEITGIGLTSTGELHTYLLTPVQ